jgi:hypothetical protein
MEKVMRHTNYQTLISRGRKAGLRTAELYTALETLRPEAGDRTGGQADGNGFVSGFDCRGQWTMRPLSGQVRS